MFLARQLLVLSSSSSRASSKEVDQIMFDVSDLFIVLVLLAHEFDLELSF